MKIRFCENNSGKGKVFRRLSEDFPELNIKIKDCIKQCSACRETPMATVAKKKVTGKDGDELYHNIVELIRKSAVSEKAGIISDK
ncbi:MAG: DUF1450 domain-containing protein [Desulfuromonadaceae bacterium]|nr:DUF1450 domain-containing protein [Desulfuromonadaceae bacterium]